MSTGDVAPVATESTTNHIKAPAAQSTELKVLMTECDGPSLSFGRARVWNEVDDKKLASLVQECGISSWSQIGRRLGRNGKQCRERWNNHLAPDIKSTQWTADEERLFIKLHQELGNKWADIAKRIPGRTENNVKNHWNATRRRRDILKTKHSLTRPDVLRNYILMLVNCNKLGEQCIGKTTTSANERKKRVNTGNAAFAPAHGPQLPATKRVKATHDGEQEAHFKSQPCLSSDDIRSVTDAKAPHENNLFSEAYDEIFGNDTDFDENGGMYSDSDDLDMDFVTSLLGDGSDDDVCAEWNPASSLQNDDSAMTTKSIAAKAGHDSVESHNEGSNSLTIDWPYVIGASCPWNDEFVAPRTNWVDEPTTPAPMTESPFTHTMDIADEIMDTPHGLENTDTSHRDIISVGRDIDIMQSFILSIGSNRAKTGSYIGRLDGYREIKVAAKRAKTGSTKTVTETALREIVAEVRNSCPQPIQCSVSLRLTTLDEITDDKKHSPQLAIYVSSTCDATDVKEVAYRIVVGIVRQFVSAH